MTLASDQTFIARQICARTNAWGNHRITGLVSGVHDSVPPRARGLCLACGRTLEVFFTGTGAPSVSGAARSEHCTPTAWWAQSTEHQARLVRELAVLTRTEGAFLGSQLEAYRQGHGLTHDEDLAAVLHVSTPALQRLHLSPALRESDGLEPTTSLVLDLAQAMGAIPHVLAPLLVAIRDAGKNAEQAQAAAQRAEAIEQARAAVVRAQAHLDSLLTAQTAQHGQEG